MERLATDFATTTDKQVMKKKYYIGCLPWEEEGYPNSDQRRGSLVDLVMASGDGVKNPKSSADVMYRPLGSRPILGSLIQGSRMHTHTKTTLCI